MFQCFSHWWLAVGVVWRLWEQSSMTVYWRWWHLLSQNYRAKWKICPCILYPFKQLSYFQMLVYIRIIWKKLFKIQTPVSYNSLPPEFLSLFIGCRTLKLRSLRSIPNEKHSLAHPFNLFPPYSLRFTTLEFLLHYHILSVLFSLATI